MSHNRPLPADLHAGGIRYIRAYYRVPARVGGRVRITAYGSFNGKLGTITGTNMGRLVVRPDERPYKSTRYRVHPREVEYLTNEECEVSA